MSSPNIVFCTTCKGRAQHVKQTLPRNIEDNKDYPNCKFVILDYGDSGELGEYLYSDHIPNLLSGHLSVYRYETNNPFHVAHAKNLAARCGILEGADILVTLDADNFTGPNFAQYIAECFSTSQVRQFLVPNHLHIRSLPHGNGRPCRGFAGRLAIRSQDFIKLGGYDEMYNTWRGEDIDMMFRLMRLKYDLKYIDNKFLNTIPHNAAIRFKEYPEAQQYENPNEVEIIRKRTETVVNYGNFGVGTVYRNYSYTPIELTHIPTRVFGIGMHKTGTTSLNKAFSILGFDSLHWGTGEAPRIWQEMNSIGRSNTLEQWYAISDLPIPLLYDKLDRSYPGSKFVLTTRNEEDWLNSVEKLWSPQFNPTRPLWKVWPFSNNIHNVLYGRDTFDRNVFLERYRRHNKEITDYFRNRPQDLLTLDIDSDSKLEDLCKFLKSPIPKDSFPLENQTTTIPLNNNHIPLVTSHRKRRMRRIRRRLEAVTNNPTWF